jgi:hypothetical protein
VSSAKITTNDAAPISFVYTLTKGSIIPSPLSKIKIQHGLSSPSDISATHAKSIAETPRKT